LKPAIVSIVVGIRSLHAAPPGRSVFGKIPVVPLRFTTGYDLSSLWDLLRLNLFTQFPGSSDRFVGPAGPVVTGFETFLVLDDLPPEDGKQARPLVSTCAMTRTAFCRFSKSVYSI